MNEQSMQTTITPESLAAFLEGATLHQISRLTDVLFAAREDPARIEAVKNVLKIGQVVTYFSSRFGQLVEGVVIKKNVKYALVEVGEERAHWKVPYHSFKLDDRFAEFQTKKKNQGLDRQSVCVGDWVGFNHQGEEKVGQVTRVNVKTVSLTTTTGEDWRVGYAGLYAVIDAEGKSVTLHSLPNME